MEPMARNAPDAASIAIGTAIGDYVIEDRLGRGSEGEVFLARDVLLGRRVALKTLRSGTAEETHGVEEARLMASIEHPHVVRVYHAERHRGVWVVILECVDGGSLQSLVQRIGPLPAPRTLELLAEAAAGLACVHQNQIVHRDLKPQNLLLSRHGQVKIGDFGLALRLPKPVPALGRRVGTPAFMAPELWANGVYSPASDIYSLGACLYFLLAGRVPFPFTNLEQLERAHAKLRPKIPSEVPIGVRQMLLAMMAKDPAARPASNGQLSRELLELARDPHRPRRASVPPKPREAASPFVPGGLDQALSHALARGPDASTVDQLVAALMAEPAGIQVAAELTSDAERLLGVALERCSPRPEVVARVSLPTPDAKLGQLLRQRSNAAPLASLAQVLEQLPALGPPGASPRRLIVIHAVHALGAAQVLDLLQLEAEAALQGICSVLIGAAGAAAAGYAADSKLVRVSPATARFSAFITRVRLWTQTATAERWDFSVDALLLLRHFSRQHGPSWPELAQISLAIAAAARLPLVTSWAVQAAHQQLTGQHPSAEVPRESRTSPRRWPSADVLSTLATLRTELELEEEASPSELGAPQPTRVARDTAGRSQRPGAIDSLT